MSCPNDQSSGTSIADMLLALGPRTVEGDQGRVSMYSVQEIIAAVEYDRNRSKMRNREQIRSVLRTISNYRLATHDGPAS